MYGTWFAVTLGGIAVLALAIAAAFLWAPLFALVMFAAVGTVMLVIAATRRSEDVPGRQAHSGDPESYAAPAGSEGASGEAEGAASAEAPEPEQAPEAEPAGMWGERR